MQTEYKMQTGCADPSCLDLLAAIIHLVNIYHCDDLYI